MRCSRREDLTDEQRLFGQTAAEFMRNEVLPQRSPPLRARLGADARAAEEGRAISTCCGSRFRRPTAASGLDKISAAYVGEQIAINPSFGGSLGAHTSIGTLPLVYFGTDEQKAQLPAAARAAAS